MPFVVEYVVSPAVPVDGVTIGATVFTGTGIRVHLADIVVTPFGMSQEVFPAIGPYV